MFRLTNFDKPLIPIIAFINEGLAFLNLGRYQRRIKYVQQANEGLSLGALFRRLELHLETVWHLTLGKSMGTGPTMGNLRVPINIIDSEL